MKATLERELVDRCRQGDEAAFRELVDQYKGLVWSLVARSIADRGRAEDVAQDVFLKVHKGLGYFRGESKLSTWIYRIVINTLSQERRQPPTESLDDPSGAARPGTMGRLDPAFGELVLRDRLTKAIDRLAPKYQVLVNGYYLKGMQYDDLAEALDLPLGTVKTHLHRAKRELRRMLETELV
jgi:RNA polymerase sigma-70 factor (ECF subfamily)